MCCCRKVNRKFEGGSHGYLFERWLPRASRKEFLTIARAKIASESKSSTSEVAAPVPAATPPSLQSNNDNNNNNNNNKNNSNPREPTTLSPKLLCVRNLAKTTDASDLLHFLNTTLQDGAEKNPSKNTRMSHTPTPPPNIQNVLVHNRVAIVSCCTPQFVDSILLRLRARSLGPIIYRGKTLEIGRPKNFMVKANGKSQAKRRHDRSVEGMVVVVTKRLDRK